MLKNIIIDGVDRLGKGTLIAGLQQQLGFFQTVHYQKPLALEKYGYALETYQRASFNKMFSMLDQGGMLLDRGHLGEAIYAPRYRGYSGSYVFDMEQQHPEALDNTLLILLTASNWDPIVDDGASFNFDAKAAEQLDFFKAWETSKFKYKMLVDVTCEAGFVPPDLICTSVASAYERLYNLPMSIMCTSWEGEDLSNLKIFNELRADPKRSITVRDVK